MDWQPIETAPKDGTQIDVWAKGYRIPDVKWGTPPHVCYGGYCDSCPTRECWYDANGLALDEDSGEEPTHWMPLPPPPALAEGEQP